jgi:hypothetical protein
LIGTHGAAEAPYLSGGGTYQWRVSSDPREPVTSKIKAVMRKYFLSFLARPVWIIIILNP